MFFNINSSYAVNNFGRINRKNSNMKRIVLLILIIYLAINDDNSVFAKPNNAKTCEIETKNVHNALKNFLKVEVNKLKQIINGICNVNGSIYETTKKELLFVKESSTNGSDKMFHGEFEGLNAIRNTKTVLVPRPIATGHTVKKNFLALEYLNATSLNNVSFAKLGSQLADMHLNNFRGNTTNVKKFGFHVDTGCGTIPQGNTWTDDWIKFIINHRFTRHIEIMNNRTDSGTLHVIRFYWILLEPMIPKFFEGIDVKPSLVHGNLRFENVGQLDSKPVVFNPAAFYGHHEYDLAAATYYGNFSTEFHDEYHKKIPKAKGFDNRVKLYYLIHLFDDWNQRKTNSNKLVDIIDELTDVFELEAPKH